MKTNLLLAAVSVVALNSVWGPCAIADTRLDDATILAIFDQANAIDIYTGRLGAKHGYSEDVRALGKMVATEHIAVQKMGRDLAQSLNIVPTPHDNDSSVADHAKTVAALQSVSGPEFDRVYLRNEIAFHQSVINAIKKTLIPAIRSREIASLVNEVLPGFEHHLAETKAVAEKLGMDR